MTGKIKPLAEITQRAIAVLSRELGAADAIRFINQFTIGQGDDVSERDTLFAGETFERIISDIEQTRSAEGQTDRGLEP